MEEFSPDQDIQEAIQTKMEEIQLRFVDTSPMITEARNIPTVRIIILLYYVMFVNIIYK